MALIFVNTQSIYFNDSHLVPDQINFSILMSHFTCFFSNEITFPGTSSSLTSLPCLALVTLSGCLPPYFIYEINLHSLLHKPGLFFSKTHVHTRTVFTCYFNPPRQPFLALCIELTLISIHSLYAVWFLNMLNGQDITTSRNDPDSHFFTSASPSK